MSPSPGHSGPCRQTRHWERPRRPGWWRSSVSVPSVQPRPAHARRCAFLWLVRKGRTRSLGAILAGFGLHLHRDRVHANGDGRCLVELQDVYRPRLDVDSGQDRDRHVHRHAKLNRGRRDDARGPECGLAARRAGLPLIVGQSIGMTRRLALVMIGGSLAVRRAAWRTFLWRDVGVLGMVFLGPLVAAAVGWVRDSMIRGRLGTEQRLSSISLSSRASWSSICLSITSRGSSSGSPEGQRLRAVSPSSRCNPRPGGGPIALEQPPGGAR